MITPEFVQKMLASKGHTPYSAARALGVSDRTVRRWVRKWPGWKPPPMIALVAIRGMPANRGGPR